jgi:type IV fimbrial biogenesis protein FimT
MNTDLRLLRSHDAAHATPAPDAGFTRYELLIVVAIVAILMALAVPSFQASIRDNRLSAAADRLSGSFNLARSEAVKQGQPVSVTNAVAGASWSGGWTICCAPAAAIGGPPGPALTVSPALAPPLTLVSSAAAAAGFQFDASGRLSVPGLTPAPALVFVFCADATGLANNSRAVLVSPSGRVRVARNGTGASAGIPIKDDGTPVASCTAP